MARELLIRDFLEYVDHKQRSQLNAIAFLLENHRPENYGDDSEHLAGVASIIQGITGEMEQLRDFIRDHEWTAKVDVDWSKPDPVGQAQRSIAAEDDSDDK